MFGHNGWFEIISPNLASTLALDQKQLLNNILFCGLLNMEQFLPVLAIYYLLECSNNSTGTVSGWCGLYSKLQETYTDTGLKFVIISAFYSTKIELWTSFQDVLAVRADATTTWLLEDITIKPEVTAINQSEEWAMRAIQSSFPRLKD